MAKKVENPPALRANHGLVAVIETLNKPARKTKPDELDRLIEEAKKKYPGYTRVEHEHGDVCPKTKKTYVINMVPDKEGIEMPLSYSGITAKGYCSQCGEHIYTEQGNFRT
ncbi:MAG: hypothetical protein PHC66_03015 [Candidatus Nanoarchaeia archaeon]|nr:hypothetical protein [Candidatus Nanoarchaeia archaeon]MDD5239316.1 hypothetical protein [Candidatus Nanoarchaeia archaeon]